MTNEIKESAYERRMRNKISEILIKNSLRTDQVAIGELHALVMKAFEEGKYFGLALRK